MREITKVVGGIAVGKLEDRLIPWKYTLPGTSLDMVRLGLGVGQLLLTATQETRVSGMAKDILDVVGVAGAQLIVEEVAKLAAGVGGTTVGTVVRSAPPAMSAPSQTFY
jgi:hypothetical protein